MTRPLAGRTVALAEGRQLEELADMLAKEGATPLRCPMVSILDAPDAGPVVDWLRALLAGQFSHVILLTGEGLRRLLGFAERAGLRDDVIAAWKKGGLTPASSKIGRMAGRRIDMITPTAASAATTRTAG